MPTHTFDKYFTLEDAVACLPMVRKNIELAQQELNALRDGVILTKRLILAKQSSGRAPKDAEVALLQEKFEAYEALAKQWVDFFEKHGILLRDIDVGLVDFPYHSQSTNQDFFLCWRLPEDGIFYFHGIGEGYAGRHPITLLPE